MTAETRVIVFVRPEIHEMLEDDAEVTDCGDYLEVQAGERIFIEVRADV